MKLEINCIVQDNNKRKYKVTEIRDKQVVIWSLDTFKSFIGPRFAIGNELKIIYDPEGYNEKSGLPSDV